MIKFKEEKNNKIVNEQLKKLTTEDIHIINFSSLLEKLENLRDDIKKEDYQVYEQEKALFEKIIAVVNDIKDELNEK